MSARENILRKVRGKLASGDDAARRVVVADRLAKAPAGILPARGQLGAAERIDLFCAMAEKLAASVQRVKSADDVPLAVARYLRSRNLRASVRMGADERLAALPWQKQKSLEILHGASDGDDETGVSYAFAGIAETGTVAMLSGRSNPTTVNFLPEHHIVVVDEADIGGDMETVIARVRQRYGKGAMPRVVNLISGPSRSGDVEQQLVLGAHGPKALHVIVVGR